MAEGLLRAMAGETYEVFSAGTEPKGLHPKAVEVMREMEIDISGHQSEQVDRYLTGHFDRVITVCDNAREHCPVFPGAASIHWSFDDPAAAPEGAQLATFRRVRDEIRSRIRAFIDADSGSD